MELYPKCPDHWPAGTCAEMTIPHHSGTYTVYLRAVTDEDEAELKFIALKNRKDLNRHIVRLTFNGGDECVIRRPELLSKAARCFALMYRQAVRAAKTGS